jgi:hypothetical protein
MFLANLRAAACTHSGSLLMYISRILLREFDRIKVLQSDGFRTRRLARLAQLTPPLHNLE